MRSFFTHSELYKMESGRNAGLDLQTGLTTNSVTGIPQQLNRYNFCSSNADDKQALLEHINEYLSPESDVEHSDSDSDPENNLQNLDRSAESAATAGQHPSSDTDDKDEEPVTFTPIENLSSFLPGTGTRPTNETELTSRKKSAQLACKCSLFNGKPCRTRYAEEELDEVRSQFIALTDQELDMVVLGKIECGMHLSSTTKCARRREQTEQKLTHTHFFHRGHPICREMFKYIHGISQDKLTALLKHYKSSGITPRVHKNTKRLPPNTLAYRDVERVVLFITNYAGTHAISLPGRTPKHWNSNLRLLPTNCSKKMVSDKYVASSAPDQRVASLTQFRDVWKKIVPFISTMRPATDLCWTCQEGAAQVARSRNLSEELKSDALRSMEQHSTNVTAERSYLNSIVGKSKEALHGEKRTLGKNQACSHDMTMHYSFDFAQQVHFPSDPLQRGPIYFKTPRKCGPFGICCEAVPQQVNYLIDESVCVGKGANCVISLLHHFFEFYGLGEKHLHLHADNCSGQNKNSAMMQYLMWRVLTSRHDSGIISFLITGHTKFSPDGRFGLVKCLYRRTKVNSLQCLAKVEEESSVVNTVQIVGTRPDNVNVVSYKWDSFLDKHFKKVKNIKSFQHMTISDTSGTVALKPLACSEPVLQHLLKCDTEIDPTLLPPILQPQGLDRKRQDYLFKEIRPFVEDSFKDNVCPDPDQPVVQLAKRPRIGGNAVARQ